MRRRIAVASLAILATVPAAARAQNATSTSRWQFVGTGNDGRNMFIDTESIDRQASTITVWTKFAYSKPQTDEQTHKRYTKELDRLVLDCHARRIGLLQWNDYDATNAMVASGSSDISSITDNEIVPDSQCEAVMKLVCRPEQRQP